MHADSFANPFARALTLAMLSFSVAAAALLLYLAIEGPAAAVADRYSDPAWQAKLARGLGWLNHSLVAGVSQKTKTIQVSDCKGLGGSDQFECRRTQLNSRLAQVEPIWQLTSQVPDDESMTDVLLAMRWLFQYSETPPKLSALLQQGQDAARQSLADPFRISGCIEFSHAVAPCDTNAVVNKGNLPPHVTSLHNELTRYVSATRGNSPNIKFLRFAPGLQTPIVQGRHLILSLTPNVQDHAQITAACYSGDTAACQNCKWCNMGTAADMFEHARARAVGILVLDAHTGGVEAAASAYTPCYVLQQQGNPPVAECPVLPNTLVRHLDRLENQAIEQTAKPGSITKIVIAVGLQKAGLHSTEVAALPDILTHSRTADLIDIVMCKAQDFEPVCAKRRLTAIADTAVTMGWNHEVDLLGAYQLPGLQAQRFTGRLLSHSRGSSMISDATKVTFTRVGLRDCSKKHWRNCKGEQLVNLVAELFGTGESLASPVGVANVLLQLAASANAQTLAPQVHLVQSAQDSTGKTVSVQAVLTKAASLAQADFVLQGLLKTATQGTARSACLAAVSAMPGSLLPCAATVGGWSQPALRIAGKTGTPVFSADQGDKKSLSLNQWRTQCERIRIGMAALPKESQTRFSLLNEAGKCNMTPTKWYAFLTSAPGSKTWDKVIVVLVERNWNQQTGLIDSPNDNGANVAAEIGLALVNGFYRPQTLSGH
jgi:hypothetical protein